MHKVRIVSVASLSIGSRSRAGKSVAVWVMINLPRCATSIEGRGQSLVVGGQACLTARYRPQPSA
jgi:hypothetical protein